MVSEKIANDDYYYDQNNSMSSLTMSSGQLEQRCEELQRAVEEARGQERVGELVIVMGTMKIMTIFVTLLKS